MAQKTSGPGPGSGEQRKVPHPSPPKVTRKRGPNIAIGQRMMASTAMGLRNRPQETSSQAQKPQQVCRAPVARAAPSAVPSDGTDARWQRATALPVQWTAGHRATVQQC